MFDGGILINGVRPVRCGRCLELIVPMVRTDAEARPLPRGSGDDLETVWVDVHEGFWCEVYMTEDEYHFPMLEQNIL